MASDLVEIVHSLRMQMAKKGAATLQTLATAFRVNDRNGSGMFNFEEFEQILGKAGLFLKRQELSKLYRHFDKNQTEQVDYREFLRALQGEVGERRMAIIKRAWDKIACGQACIPVNQVLGSHNASSHPKVLSGEKSEQEIFREFVRSFEGAADPNGMISWQRFADYYAGISASVPYNDDYFVQMMERAWGIEENEGTAELQQVPSELIRKVQNVLREKIRQKTGSTKSGMESLRKAFKHFDLDDCGMVTFKEFLLALQRFGCVLEEKVAAALFNDFDPAGSGKMNYAEFAAVLYQEDELAASYKGLTVQPSSGSESKREYFESANVLVSAPAASTEMREDELAATVVFVLGGPGSGKGTQCANIVQEFGFVHLSAGDLLRTERDNATSPDAGLIRQYIQNGMIVPVEITIKLIRQAMHLYMSQGKLYFLIDGFPRNMDNLAGWNKLMPDINVPIMLFFDCPEPVMEQRLLARGATSGRSDDNIDSIRKRFKIFRESTLPVAELFAQGNRVRSVFAIDPPDQVYAEVRKIIASLP